MYHGQGPVVVGRWQEEGDDVANLEGAAVGAQVCNALQVWEDLLAKVLEKCTMPSLHSLPLGAKGLSTLLVRKRKG